MTLPLKKSKTKLLYSILIILLISFLIKFYQKPISKYDKNETTISGIITECKKNNDSISIIIKGKEKVLINYYNEYKCILGTKIYAYGKLEKPNKNTTFYLFNYRNYLLSKKIYYKFNASNIKNINDKIPLKYKIKNKIIKHIEKYKSKNYLKTFILGDNSKIEKLTLSSYQNNGISHLFAISGFHVAILSNFLLHMLNKFLNKKYSYLITISFLIFYLFMTNFPPSFLRATMLFIMTTIKKVIKAKVKTTYILILIFLILLNINPYYVYSLGFILSFTITFYIILANKIINKQKNYFSKNLVISIIAYIVSMPIIINNYFKINLLSPLISIFFTPFISLVIYPLSLMTVFIKPLDSFLYNLTNIIENISLKISNRNNLIITFPHTNLFFILLYFILITLIIEIWKNKSKNYIWIVIILLLTYKNIYIKNQSPTITILDVNQGDSILVKLKKSKGNILIDTGGMVSNKTYDIAKNTTIPYLNAEGIDKLNYLIITHGDFDHMGEAINLINNFKVEKVIFNCGPYNNLEKELIKVLDKKKIKYYSCIKELNIDNNKLYFLQTKEYNNENDNSNVIYTELNGYRFMFMGDASITTEKEILDKYNLTDIDVLKVGHHGSKTSSGKEFINEINPGYSIISVGKNNRYGHPNNEVLNNLSESKIYRTDQDGSIKFKIKNNKLKVETCAS